MPCAVIRITDPDPAKGERMNPEVLVSVRQLLEAGGPYVLLALGVWYLAKRLIDKGYELHLKPPKRR